MNYIQNHIKNTQIVDMVIKLSVHMMINVQNKFKFIEVKMQFTNSWKNVGGSEIL